MIAHDSLITVSLRLEPFGRSAVRWSSYRRPLGLRCSPPTGGATVYRQDTSTEAKTTRGREKVRFVLALPVVCAVKPKCSEFLGAALYRG